MHDLLLVCLLQILLDHKIIKIPGIKESWIPGLFTSLIDYFFLFLFNSSFRMVFRITLTRLTTRAPKKAFQKTGS